MKKTLLILLAVVWLCLAGCSVEMVGDTSEAAQNQGQETALKDKSTLEGEYLLALVLDETSPEEEYHVEQIWAGISAFAEEMELTCAYYAAASPNQAAREEAVNQAVLAGAEIVFCYGANYEPVVYQMQKTCPDTEFVLFDGEPRAADYSDYALGENVEAIYFAEAEMGYLAGYAAVMEGYTQLGFMAGLPVSSVMRYGGGYLQGIHDAAKATQKQVTVTYYYSGLTTADDSLTSMAGNLYLNNVQVIFTCEEDFIPYLAKAAEAGNHKVIGVCPEDYTISETVLTCIKKEYAQMTELLLNNYYQEMFQGGTVQTLDVGDGAISLDMENSRFAVFSQTEYNTLLSALAEHKTVVQDISDPAYDLTTMYSDYVTVTVLE